MIRLIMAKQFINREGELAFLKTKREEQTPQLLIIYGRRRVGKTELLIQFMRENPNVPSIYFLAGRKRWVENIRELQNRMAEVVGDSLFARAEFSDYIELFCEFSKRYHRQIVITIDEFPYLHDPTRDIESMFQKIYDEIISKTEIYLILCGSSIAMMEGLFGYRSPLYGRRTGQWLVEPLGFNDSYKFFPRYDIKDAMAAYAVLGGIPFHLTLFDDQYKVMENIERTLLNKGSVLYNEPEFLLREELREPRNYFSILNAISSGATKFSEILNATGMDKGMVSRYLDVLHDLRFIRKSVPVTLTREKIRNTRYYVADNLFKFWFKFVYPNAGLIESGDVPAVIRMITSQFDSYTSFAFEDVSKEFLYKIRQDLPFRFDKIGRWWHKDAEIDLVALNEHTREIMFVECKWQQKKAGVNVLKNLMATSELVDWGGSGGREHYCVISKSGLTASAEAFAQEKGIISFDLTDMVRVFGF